VFVFYVYFSFYVCITCTAATAYQYDDSKLKVWGEKILENGKGREVKEGQGKFYPKFIVLKTPLFSSLYV